MMSMMSHVPMQTLRLLAATALVGMVLLAFAGQLPTIPTHIAPIHSATSFAAFYSAQYRRASM